MMATTVGEQKPAVAGAHAIDKGQASRVPLSSADPYIGGIYRLAVQSVEEMGLQGGFTGL